ncbi:MAG: glutathione S-transferase family protein [Gammaproteobacteria bacterium]|nr:glutathione S-transferase family protein [Gammaproteobacteria bacterium]
MASIKLLGLRISVYTRIARLALEEKKVDYELQEVDIFADTGPPPEYLECNPFGTIPCLKYGNFSLYETGAICRYVDEMFLGMPLQPKEPAPRARMNQIISVLDSYTYRPMVWDIYVQRIVVPGSGGQADEALIASALPALKTVLQEIDGWRGDSEFLVGDAITLADLYAYPMLRYFIETGEGLAMLATFPRLNEWLTHMQTRASARATSFHWGSDGEDGF